MSHPERIIPDETLPGIVALHLKRYVFAEPFCAGGDVLDAACGAGYGTAHLAATARSVLGVDASVAAIDYARAHYARANVRFEVMDVQQLDIPSASVNAVCSFETIEHVDDPEQTLAEFARVLRPSGALIVSTPNARVSTRSPENPHHRQEWSAGDFATLLQTAFTTVELYGQQRHQTAAHRLAQRLDVVGLRRRLPRLRGAARILGTVPTADLTLDNIVIERDALARATEVVAICTNPGSA